MKKKVALLLSVFLIVQMLGSFSVMVNGSEQELQTKQTTEQVTLKQPNGMAVETKNVIKTDALDNVPSSLKNYVDTIDSEAVFHINSNSKITGGPTIGTFGANAYLEADVKMLSSTAATSGCISITPHDRGSAAARTVRFAYIFAVPLNEETMMGLGGPVIKDRLAIVDTGDFNINKWRFVKISDNPLGVLSATKNETEWIRLKVIVYNDVYYFSAFDDKGNLLDSLSATKEELFGDDKDNIKPGGSFRATFNASEFAFDNISGGDIDVVEGLEMKFETSSAKVGTPVRYYFENSDGNKLKLEGAEPVTDGVKTTIEEDGSVIFNETGKQEFAVKVSNLNTGAVDEYKAEINILNEIDFKKLEVTPAQNSVYKNAAVPITVKGVDAIGDKFVITPDEYKITSPAADNDEAGTVDFEQSGMQKIKVEHRGVSGEADIYVSKYEKLTPSLSLTTIEQKSSVSYSLLGTENGVQRMFDYNEYAVTSDKDGLVISPNGIITAAKIGTYTLSFTKDNVTEKINLNVIERQQGILINENFDTPGDGQYFTYRQENIVNDNGNKVLRVADEETEFYGGEAWKAYTINAKVKIVKSVLDERCQYSTFEITPLKKYNTTMGFVGGEGGIQCIYRLNHKIDSGSHMRISAVAGPQINIEDGKYHDFRVDVYENQVIFSIDGIKQYYYQSRDMTGYFTFTANNCEAYVDNLTVTRNLHSEKKERAGISAEEEIVEVNPYAPVQFRAINAFRLNYTDGTHTYVTNMGTYDLHGANTNRLWFEVVDGEEDCTVRNGYTLVFNKDVPAGAEVTIKANLDNFSCLFKVKAAPPDMTYEEYVKTTVDLRKESQTFRLIKGWGNGIDNSMSSRGTLPHRMAIMTVYPKIYDHTEAFRWYAKAVHYEEVYIGRGSDAGDFILQQGMATYMTLKGIANVSNEAWEEWKQFILQYRWIYPHEGMTENHRGIYYATAVMAGETFPNDIMYDGKTGKETFNEHLKYLTDWFNYRYTRGHAEYDSGEYYNINLFNAELLYNSIKNEQVKQAAYDYMTFVYADMLPEELGGRLTGAHLRSYHKANMNHMNQLSIYFNLSDYMIDESAKINVQEVPYSMSTYIPPDILYDIAFDDDKTGEITERHFLYALVDDPLHTDSIVKYTYRTPEYSVGTKIYSDEFLTNPEYSVVSSNRVEINNTYKTEVLPNHQGYMWSITFGNDRNAEITENHPGTYEFYGDGTWICDCGKYYQHKGASMGMHKITGANRDQRKCSHFYIPKDILETVEEENGWVFINHEEIYAAIKPLKDGKTNGVLYEWGSPDRSYNGIKMSECELLINSANTAFVSEATSKSEFGGTFDEFKAKVKENEKNIVYKISDDNYSIEYTALDGTKLKIDYNNNKRYLNDTEVDFSETKLFDSKYVQSDWGSGTITISNGEETLVINPVKYNIDITTAWEFVRKINKHIDELEYEMKVGRGALYIAANTADLIECTDFISKYNKDFLFSIIYGRLKVLSEKVTKCYDISSTSGRSQIENIVKSMQAEIKK